MSEKEKHKHKDKKRKENGEDDKEAKKEKKDKKKEKKDKEKDKEKEAKSGADAKAKTLGMMGVPKPVDAATAIVAQAGDRTNFREGSSKFSDKPPPEIQQQLEIQAQKRLKTWQDDELEVDSGDEGSTKLQTLSSVAAQSLGHGATGSTSSPTKAQDADSLDAYMLDIAKERPGVTNEDKATQESQEAGLPMQMQRKPEGMSVMDSARVKTVTLEDILALMGGGASSSSSKPPEEPMIQDAEAVSTPAPTTAEVPAVDAVAPADTVSEEQDEAFHVAFMAQMRKLRGEKEDVIDDGSDTAEEWDEDRKERERKRMEQLHAKWKAKDERAAARQKAREARLAAGEEEGDSDHSSDTDEASKPMAVVEAHTKGPLTKKEKRRIRREQKLKDNEDKEEAAKQLKKKSDGKEEEEQLHSDADGSEDSEMEKPAESYFDLVKRYTTKKTLPVVDHATMDYKSFTKNLYVQVKEITAMKDHEVDDFRKTNGEIQVRGKNCPRPIKSFLQCGLPEKVLKLLEKRECIVPFPIQMQAIPALMCGRDMIGVAQTGSGKTMAYLLPMIRHALAQLPTRIKGDEGPVGFIIAPTRELALQISRECSVLCKACNMRCVCAFGGGPMGEQLSALKKGTEILVGTPGRLIDCLTTSNGKITNLRLITFLVLDEADRMFDMGFEPQIGMFLQATRPDKQVAMLSATLPTHVEALARQCLKKPIEITVGERNTAAINITQKIEVLEESQKFYRLLQLLGEWHEHGSVIIFVHQQRDVDEMFTELLKFGYPALALHGGQDQCDRDFTVQDFKDGVANILVATSVAARGLDVKKVILVVNFKVPDHLEDYIHRIGRTGRAGKPGFAYTFIQPDEGDRAQDMLDALRQCGQTVPEALKRLTEDFQSQINRGEAKKRRKWGGFGGKGFKYDSTEQSRQQKDRQKAKKESLIGGEIASEDEEEFKDAWNEDKPLSAAAAAASGKDKGKGKGKKGKGKDDDSAKPEVTKETPKNTGEAAAQIADRLKAELAEKERLPEAAAGTPAAAAPQAAAAGTLTAPTLFAPARLGGAVKDKPPAVVKKTDEELDAEAQAKAEEVLKNLSEEMRADKLPKLKEKLKAKLIKDNEVAATTERPGPPKPPEAPQEETPLMKATSVVPGVLGVPTQIGGASSMVSRSIQQLADGILSDPGKRAAEAAEIAARLGNPNMACPAGMFMEELDINDYPQIARQKISHREPLLQIEELTGAKVQVRGQYFANPSKMPDGCRLLYVECIGPTATAATKAKYEVHKMMEALAIRTLNIPGASRAVMGTPGRYDPSVGK